MDNFIEFDYKGKHYIRSFDRRDLELLKELKHGDRVSFTDMYGFGEVFNFDEMKNINTSFD